MTYTLSCGSSESTCRPWVCKLVVPGECSVFIVVASPALFTLRSLSRVTFRVSPADARSVGPTAMRSVIAEEEGLYPRVLYENAVPDTAVVKLTVYCSTLMMVAALDAVNSVIACSRGVDHSGREERQGERAQARASMHGSHPVLNDAGAQAVVETEKPCCPSVQHKNCKTADVETLLEMVLVTQSY